MKVSAEHFFDAWKNIFEKEKDKIIKYWDDYPSYTKEIQNLYPQIAKSLNLKYAPEYYSTDVIFYEEKHSEFYKNQTFVINPEIVFEHENNANSFFEEIAHHLILKANLYVIVSYCKTGIEDYLDEMRLFINNRSSNANELKEKRNFLVILGNEGSYITNNYWKGYIFNGDDWIVIN